MSQSLSLGVIGGMVQLDLSQFDLATNSILDGVVSIQSAFDTLTSGAEAMSVSITGSLDSMTASLEAQIAAVDTLAESYDRMAGAAAAAAQGNIRATPVSYANASAASAASADASATSVAALDTSSAATSASLGGLDASAGGLDAAFAGLDASAAGADASLAGLDAASAGADASLSALSGAGAASDVALSALQASLDALDASLAAASTAVEANTVALGENAGAANTANVAQKKAAGGAGTLADGFSKVQMPLLLAGAAVVALGAVAVHMAGDFQESMTQLVTGAGESQANLKLVSDGVLALAPQVGESTKQLAAGLYLIESAGYHGAAGLNILKAAAEGAKVGNADLAVVADATTTILNDYGASGVTAANAVNILTATVASGKTHLADLATSLAQILPTAAAAGVGLGDVMGALAAMTSEGVPAAQAATYLRQTIISLDAPGKLAVTTLNSIGISAASVANGLRVSLPDTLQMITDALGKKFPQGAALAAQEMKKVQNGSETFDQALQNLSGTGAAQYIDALKNIAGGAKTMQGMLDLTGGHLATFKQDVAGVTGAVKKGGSSITGWALASQDFNTKMAQAGATVEVIMIKIGLALMPAASALMAHLMPAVNALSTWATTHSQDIVQGIEAIAVALGVGLVVAATAAVIALDPLIFAAAGIVLVFAAVAAGVVVVIQHWSQITALFESSNPVLIAVKGAILALSGALVGFGLKMLINAIPGIWASVTAFWAQAVAAGAAAIAVVAATWPFILAGAAIGLLVLGIIELIQHWGAVSAFFENLWKAISGWFASVGAAITGWFGKVGAWFVAFGAAIGGAWSKAWNGLINAITGWFGKVGAWFVAFGAAISAIWTGAWNGLINAIGGFFLWLWTTVTARLNAVHAFFASIWLAIYNAIKGPLDAVLAVVVPIFNFIAAVIRVVSLIILKLTEDAWNAIWAKIVAVATAIRTWLVAAWNAITKDVTIACAAILKLITLAWNAIWAIIVKVATAIRNWLVAQWTLINKDVDAALALIQKLVNTAWNAIITTIMTAVLPIVAWLSARWTDIWNDVTAAWKAISQTIFTWWTTITTTIQNALLAVRSWLLARWHDVQTDIENAWNEVWTLINDAWTRILTLIESQATALKNAILKPFQDARDEIEAIVKTFANNGIGDLNKAILGWQTLANDLGGAINAVAKAVGVSAVVPSLTLPQIPLLASGTPNFAGGLAVVGEEGPEMVHLPAGASVLPAIPTSQLLKFGLGFLRGIGSGPGGIPGFAGGGGGSWWNDIGGAISNALGDLNAMIQEGPQGILDKMVKAAGGLNPSALPGDFATLGKGTLTSLEGWVKTYLGTLLNGVSSSGSGGGLTYSGTGGGFANAANFSEFHGYFGDCGPTAELLALHVIKGAALTAADLDNIVHRDQAAGWASGSGVIGVGGIMNDLSRFENVASQSFGGGAWLSLLNQYAGKKPIIFLYSRAGAGLPGDERGVQWHYNTNLGSLGNGRWLFGDGDNSLASSGKLNIYTTGNLATASPNAEIVVGLANGGILSEPVLGTGLVSGGRYLLGEAGPEAVIPLGRRSGVNGSGVGGDTYHITVEVVASPDDGEPYQAGQAFGNGFAQGFQQARTQRGL